MKTNLISISGRIDSGKDTVASMIQFLTRHNNYKGSFDFKDEFEDWNRGLSIDSAWQVKKFAGKLKQIASILTNIPLEKFEDKEFKKSYLGDEWDFWSYDGVTAKSDNNENNNLDWERMTVRKLLQKLGTEGIRNQVHGNAWVNALFVDWDNANPAGQNWIITDARFQNEIQAVKDRGGITIVLMRNANDVVEHISEEALELNSRTFDYVINNHNQTLEETFEDVVKLTEKLELT